MPFNKPGFTGFPFDDDFDRRPRRGSQDRFQSSLDDWTNRIPELAGHFPRGFPFSPARGAARRQDPVFRRFADGFDDFDGAFPGFEAAAGTQQEVPQQSQQQSSPHQQYYQEPAQEYYQPPPPPPQQSEDSCSAQQEPATKNNLQQSNTVDLGQQQEPVNDRNQRSMSAPPDNRPRFTSHVTIPMNMDSGNSQQENQQKAENKQQDSGKPVERVIPIHIEGRDQAFTPKNAGSTFQQPEPEKLFGRRPEFYKQYMANDPRKEWAQHDPFSRQFVPPQFQQRQFSQPQAPKPPPKPQSQQVPKQEPPQQPQAEKQPTPPPAQPPKPLTYQEQIEIVKKDVDTLMEEVNKFSGQPKDKQFLYLDEMLTRQLIKLDNIDTQEKDEIRQARREAVKYIQKCAGILESKANANVQKPEETMEVVAAEEKTEEPQQQMDTTENKEEKPSEAMEVEGNQKVEDASDVPDDKRAVLVQKEESTTSETPKEENTVEDTKVEEANVESQVPEDQATDKKEKKKGKKKLDK
ncbi:unnamed protein product [Brassicogethes aeneus]|uniref:BAG domain-containing protein n=1 Tax=Brassicogethes aeneus TaxID=1431903 RepID=A0A9P0BJ74_BRAAE|nr:unnamed protein product [Brassicogethes aeneus]